MTDVDPAATTAATTTRTASTADAADGGAVTAALEGGAVTAAVEGGAVESGDVESGDVEVVCLGETMVVLRPDPPASLAYATGFARGTGGAESNVACTLARSGHRVRWISRLGADGFGDHVLATIAATGVDTSGVERDPDLPTGVYFRTHGDRGSTLEVAYYRAGSAASALSPTRVAQAATDAGRVLHLTGITAALSSGCAELLHTLTASRPVRPLISFDVNYRADLWAHRDRSMLLALANRADLVFVGADEAAQAWGTAPEPAAVRAVLPRPRTLVVKQGAAGATVFVRGPLPEEWEDEAEWADEAGWAEVAGRTEVAARVSSGRADLVQGAGAGRPDLMLHVPAPQVDVVAPVGAGDAFAAGYLSATLRGLPLLARIRHGHVTAAAALTDPDDLAPPPSRALADRLVALDDRAWSRLSLGRGWAGPEAAAESSPARTAGQVPKRGPGHSAGPTPALAGASPAPDHPPVPGHAPVPGDPPAPGHAPVLGDPPVPGHAAAPAPGHPPGHTSDRAAGQAAEQARDPITGRAPGRVTGSAPGPPPEGSRP